MSEVGHPLAWAVLAVLWPFVAFGQLPPEFHVDTIGPSTYVVWESDALAAPVHGNTTFVIGSQSVLVVDGSRTQRAAQATLALLRAITDLPVSHLVNTHWHEDHVLGNAVYVDSFPGLRIVAHESTAEAMREEAEDEFPGFVDAEEERLALLREQLQTGADGNGDPISGARRTRMQSQLEMFAYLVPQDRSARWVFPNLTFEEGLELDLGNRVVRVSHFGRGNTAGDAVIILPDARVLVVGDLVVYPIPYGSGSFPEEWVGVMTELTELPFDVLVPGHGPVQRDRQYLDGFTELLRQVVQATLDGARNGLSEEEILEEIRGAPWVEAFLTSFAPRDEARRALGPFFLRPVVQRTLEGALQPTPN